MPGEIALDPLCRDAWACLERPPCEALAIRGRGRSIMLPGVDVPLEAGDEILFCRVPWVEHMLQATLRNPCGLRYVVSGVDSPRGYVVTWLQGERQGVGATPALRP